MKKQFLVWLLAGAASHLYVHAQPYFVPNVTPVSQTVFSPTEIGRQQCNYFVWLPDKNRIWFDLNWANQLDKLPSIDSVIGKTANLLGPLLDSFAVDGWVRRIEVDLTQEPALFRVITHMDKPKAYTKMEDELVQVKMDQDTIRIKVLKERSYNAYINLLVNNAGDIKNLPPDAGERSRALIAQAIEKHYKAPIKPNSRHAYYAVFNLETGEMVSPESKNFHAIRSGSDQLEITLVKPSIAYARGSAFTAFSFGAAFNYAKTRGIYGSRLGFGVYWEPQFSFRSDSVGKVQSSRNDFLTLRFEERNNKVNNNFEFLSTLSISYLIRRSGNYFENNTFRVGMPGLASGRLQIEPEIYFNDFLKNLSPGIRLSLMMW
jgi:hypothetical protein